MFFLQFRTLHRYTALLILSFLLILNILIISTVSLNIVIDSVLVLLPFAGIILWFNLWRMSWGKLWILAATLLLVFALVYYKIPSLQLYLAHVFFLIFMLGIMFLYDRDQLQQKRLHQRHLKAIQVLLHQKTSIMPIVDYTREAIMILDNSGTILESNHLINLLLMLPESSLVGHSISEILGILPNPTTIRECGEFAWKTPTEETKHLRFQTQPLLDQDRPYGILLTLFDISEEKKRSEASVQYAKLSIINQVSAGLAHEIRNPLTTIKGFMQLITPDQWPESFRPYQQLLLDEIQTIDQILNKFILLTSPSAPQLKLINITEVLRSIAQTIEPCGQPEGVTVVLDLKLEPVYVLGDQEQLAEALLSLLNNAIEASPQGGTVILRLTVDEQNVRISVIDNGHGIPENLRQRVLDPFFTQKEGTGLGLTIAQRIVLAHHGKLHFKDSSQLRGTEVMIDLPRLENFTSSLSA
ncbi:ATP-binding protein [Desulfosporosinus sp. PR]|uniref:two-component system sensor histidine kinase NtrB n=1 Tax=Candidatus Desulfosporosinus nitrosoreducens TaxID=3401928 RepID=UPI0027F35510|nr:ATP-binding protein [Desulfosporosinus sp. PR]MDQ7096065.1 ATP-binding protein [Desulfosporosinus sp. PR]